ncbi:hypothetical protein CesoFtcFv8_025678 [Champsocephalus esox]|uniref:Uncharacterized protein n=1 Tax=Champsocephalus esox TaxID=159716 RepID=A0AAN8B0T8_9TELE|nr:hypothetical protein CesoFtcFv8_025678 [Champsocephalus esox]
MKEDVASLAGRCAATSKQLQPQHTVAAADPQKKQPGDDDDDGGGDGGNNNKIEIVKGSGVFCRRDAWKASIHTTRTAMVRTLLLGTFPLEACFRATLTVASQSEVTGSSWKPGPRDKGGHNRGNNEEVATHNEGPAG